MGEYSARKNILKEISILKSEYQIVDFIEENIPKELLEEDDFISQLIEVNPKVEIALEILTGKEISKKIIEEIEDKGLESVIEDEEKLKKVPKNYKEDLYKLAQKYEKEEEFEKAKKIYGKIVEFGAGQVGKFYQRNNEQDKARETIYYKSKFAYYKCKIQNGEKLTDEDMAELENLAKEDKYNILGLTQKGKITAFELFESLFDDITIDEIEQVILPIITSHRGGIGGVINPPGPKKENEYESELSPEKRLEHLKTDFEIESCKIGKGKFVGTFIFKIKNSDVVIVEKFYDVMGRKNNKVIVPSYGAATYYVHKDAQIDLEQSDRSHLVEMKKEEQKKDAEGTSLKLIASRIHKGKNYYEDQVKIFKKIEENGKKIRQQSETQIEEQIAESEKEEPMSGNGIEGKDASQDKNILQSDEADIDKEDVDKETPTPEKEEDTNSSGYTLEEMLTLIEEFDKEYAEFQSQLIDLDQKISELTIKIAELKQDIEEQMNGLLTKDNIITVIKEELSTIEECKAKRKELEDLKEKIIIEEKKNREERDKLKEEFQSKIKGEE